ncbi:MAG: Flp pilus assembly protein CpaB, partial [Anaerolineae bacterium]
EKQIPPGAMFNTYEVEGKIATTDILQGQVIQDAMITDEEAILREGENASILIPKGKVAVAFPIDVISSVSYAIQPGDFIDVLITMKFIDLDEASQTRLPLRMSGPEECEVCAPTNEQIARVATQLIVQDVEVLKVGLWGAPVTPPPAEGEEEAVGEEQPAPARPEYLTLLVSQQDALVLKYAHESGARLDLALRSSGDHDLMTTEPVTLDYMLARFGIAVPPKRPYTLQSFEEIELGGLE